jgi:hypothetical protein
MVTIEIPDALIPEGFEATGEYRIPRENEYYVSGLGLITSQYTIHNGPRVILRKIPKQIGWRFVRTGPACYARIAWAWYESQDGRAIWMASRSREENIISVPGCILAYPLRREPIYEGESS